MRPFIHCGKIGDLVAVVVGVSDEYTVSVSHHFNVGMTLSDAEFHIAAVGGGYDLQCSELVLNVHDRCDLGDHVNTLEAIKDRFFGVLFKIGYILYHGDLFFVFVNDRNIVIKVCVRKQPFGFKILVHRAVAQLKLHKVKIGLCYFAIVFA